MKRLIGTVSALALLGAAGALAQTSPNAPQPTPPAQGNMTQGNMNQASASQDQTFARQAALTSQTEMVLGRYAQDHATNPAVREFGRWMVTDHTLATTLLAPIAQSANLQLPNQLDQEHQEVVSRLTSLTGARFDHEYLQAQVQRHERAVTAFQQQIQSGQNGALKTYAQNLLPAIQAHGEQARELQETTGTASARTTPHTATERLNQHELNRREAIGNRP